MKSKEKKNMNQRLSSLPNPMHLAACIRGGTIQKNKKKYNRKAKYKKELDV